MLECSLCMKFEVFHKGSFGLRLNVPRYTLTIFLNCKRRSAHIFVFKNDKKMRLPLLDLSKIEKHLTTLILILQTQ